MIPMRGDCMRWVMTILVVFILTSVAVAGEDVPVYRLHVGDQLRFVVWNEADLNITIEVLEDGSITLPLVGRLVVEGMPLTEVEEECRAALEMYLVNPVVNVIVTKAYVSSVKIIGRIQGPGKVYLQPGDTLLDVIATVGGFSSRCDVKHILILNKNGSRIVNLRPIVMNEEIEVEIDISVMDGDLIIVPEVDRPNWDKAITYINGIIQALILVAK